MDCLIHHTAYEINLNPLVSSKRSAAFINQRFPSLIKSDKVKSIEESATVCLFVMQLGDLAYQDKDRFQSGAWCKEGDFVITRAYSGTRIKIHGKEFRIINDDTVEAVVDDPRGYERA